MPTLPTTRGGRRLPRFTQAAPERARIKPGSLFLERGGPNGYLHCGIVKSHDNTTMDTYEGNSNQGGSNNGYEALARTRWFKNMDFALI